MHHIWEPAWVLATLSQYNFLLTHLESRWYFQHLDLWHPRARSFKLLPSTWFSAGYWEHLGSELVLLDLLFLSGQDLTSLRVNLHSIQMSLKGEEQLPSVKYGKIKVEKDSGKTWRRHTRFMRIWATIFLYVIRPVEISRPFPISVKLCHVCMCMHVYMICFSN